MEDYLLWIKAEVMVGHQVTITTLFHSGKDPQYDHEVSVMGIGTNYPTDATTFHPDDILYFDDHGVYTLVLQKSGKFAFASNPSVPLGAGADTVGCTPYIFSYTFGSLARTRSAANTNGAPAYSIVIPGTGSIATGSGNTAANGTGTASIEGPHNYAVSIAGPLDPAKETLPVTVAITGSTTNGKPNPMDPVAGFNYETPYIGGPVGTCDAKKQCVSNTQPTPMTMAFEVTVSGLTPGASYNLYEYDFPSLSGVHTGSGAALNVPTANFNADFRTNSSAVQRSFIAPNNASSYTFQFTRSSDQIVIFRAVPASAP